MADHRTTHLFVRRMWHVTAALASAPPQHPPRVLAGKSRARISKFQQQQQLFNGCLPLANILLVLQPNQFCMLAQMEYEYEFASVLAPPPPTSPSPRIPSHNHPKLVVTCRCSRASFALSANLSKALAANQIEFVWISFPLARTRTRRKN